jgi:processive 1,2-diacylglycerol beta-glucosyltransferase
MMDWDRLLRGANGNGHTNGQANGHSNGHTNGHTNGRVNGSEPGKGLRILVLSVSAGTGHLRAAQAIELAVRQMLPGAHVENHDVLEMSTKVFRHCYGDMYLDFVDRAPQVLGFFYNLMDHPGVPGASRWAHIRLALERMCLRRFIYFLQCQRWDLVISTHFLAGEIIAALRREKRFSAPHVMVTTDFETHGTWVNQPCEHYFTATEEGARYLESFGVPANEATAVGIPIHPVFSEPKDRAECRARHGLSNDRPIVLQLAGGHGVGRIRELYQAILAVEKPLDVVVVTGHNERAKKQLEQMSIPERHRRHIIGYTTEIDEFMRAADLVVSKPGGLTTSELLAVGAPLVIVDPIPGQEDRNSDFLLEQGAAIKVNHAATLPLKLTELLRDPDRLEQLRANALRLSRPQAAFEVVERSLAFLPHPVRVHRPRPVVRSKESREQQADTSHSPGRNGIPREEGSRRPPATDYGLPTTDSRSVEHLAVSDRLRREWRASQDWFDLLELEALHLFARVWHRCAGNGPSPLPEKGPVIVIANHPNHADPAFLAATSGRPLRFLHAGEYYDVPVLRRLFARAGCIPVARDGGDAGAVRRSLRLLQEGAALCIFPEGEISGVERRPIGKLGRNGRLARGGARCGAAYLALRSRAPVYPAYIDGGPQRHHLLNDWLVPSPGVQVCYGPPIDLSRYFDRPIDQELLREVTDLFMQCIAELRPEEGPFPEVGDQKSEVRSQRSEVRGQRSEVRSQ